MDINHAYDLHPDPLVDWGGDRRSAPTTPPFSFRRHSPRRLWRLSFAVSLCPWRRICRSVCRHRCSGATPSHSGREPPPDRKVTSDCIAV